MDSKISRHSQKTSRLQLLAEFDTAPAWALFGQEMVAAIRNCSIALCERDRWEGKGIPFIKDGHRVLYRKSDILTWLDNQQLFQSTAEAESNHLTR